MNSLYEVWKEYDSAFREHCDQFGVRTVPFWRLGIPDRCPYDPVKLRDDLVNALLSDNSVESFCERCVPAFLLWMQTQATGHSHRLWDETVIPLLGGSGPGGDSHRIHLRLCFNGQHSFHTALRRWLTAYGRKAVYYEEDNYHFWFVRAVIGECALLWIRNEFVERFFNGSLTDWARVSEARSYSEARFEEIYGLTTGIDREGLASIAALRECMVEAGVRLAALAKFACGQLPPAGGWSVDLLLARARDLLGIRLSDFPRAVIDILRKYIERGMSVLSLDQLVAYFRLHPEAVFRYAGGTWTLRDNCPPPVTQGLLCLGNGTTQPATLVDDLGRGPKDILGVVDRYSDVWHEQDGLEWKVSRSPFSVDHPSRLRTAARLVVDSVLTFSQPTTWVWTGPASANGRYSHREIGAGVQAIGDRPSNVPRRLSFRLIAWPSLDAEMLPCFYVLHFQVFGEYLVRVKLVSEGEDDQHHDVWAGLPPSEGIYIRRRTPAKSGAPNRFAVYESSGQGDSFVRQLIYRWPCPALFSAGRRLLPGQHLRPREGRIVLVTTGTPEVRGGQLRLLASGHPRLNQAAVYEALPDQCGVLSIATEGERWRLESRERPLLRLRLIQGQTEAIDSTTYAFSEPGVRVFFMTPPIVTLYVSPSSPDVQMTLDQMWDLIGNVQLAVGRATDPEPEVRVTCGSLRDEFLVNAEGQEFQLSLPLTTFSPVHLLEPGLEVRRVGLDGWLETEENDAADSVAVTGQGERFAILPYSRESILCRSPGRRGGLRLEDSSGVYHGLELLASDSDEIPSAGQSVIDWVPLSVHLPFSSLRLESRRPIPLLGAWFFKSTWDLHDLLGYFSSPCVRVVPARDGHSLRVAVFSTSPEREDRLIGEDTSFLVESTDLSLAELLPANLRSDVVAQRTWLSSPTSVILVESDGVEVGKVTLDLRPGVIAFRLVHQGEPTAAGSTVVELEAEVIPGYVADQTFDVETFCAVEKDVSVKAPVILKPMSTGFGNETLRCRVELGEPKEYRLELRRSRDSVPVASLAVTARPPTPPDKELTLARFLESWPSEEPTLANIVYLYRFIRHLPAPWDEFDLYRAVDQARDEIRDCGSVRYQLIDTLFGFLEVPTLSSTRVELIQPGRIPAEVLAEVGTVALHLLFNTDEALRIGLPEWEAVFIEASKDPARTPAEQEWLQLLARTAHFLTGRACALQQAAPPVDHPVNSPYFPCRQDFLAAVTLTQFSRSRQ